MQTIEIKNIREQLHRAETYLNAYLNEKPTATKQIVRLHLLVTQYEEMLKNKGIQVEQFREAA